MQPFVTYLQSEMGRPIDARVPAKYGPAIEGMKKGEIDIGYLGGLAYIKASEQGTLPLVQRDVDQNFHSLFITKAESKIYSLTDLPGHTFTFGDPDSGSGHLMPVFFMRQQQVDQAVIEGAMFSGGHEATLLAVVSGKAEAGAIHETLFKKYMEENHIPEGAIRVFYTTPPYPDDTWAARKDLPPEIADTFINAMLKLTPDKNPEVLKVLHATKYVRAADAGYARMRKIYELTKARAANVPRPR
jgi:phosphonate transport system substrate-binding protein